MMPVLLLDTSFAARPVHDWLCAAGFDVWTLGNRPQDLLARRRPDRYIAADYADHRGVQAHVDRLGIRYVVPGCTDVSIETAQRLTGLATRLDPPETYQKLADKAAFRALCADYALPAPRRLQEADLPCAGPVIAKPANSFSGRGVRVFDGRDRTAARQALDEARAESRNGSAIIEQFVAGQLHSYSCFLEDRRVVEAVIVREDGSVSPYTVDTSHVVAGFPAAGVAQLRDSVERLARNLSLVDGLLHAQFIWDGFQPWLIELSRRCPGDLYPRLVELSTGLPYAARYASYFVNRPAPKTHSRQNRLILRHTVTAGHDGFDGLWFEDPAPVVEFHPLVAVGRPRPPLGQTDRVALVFLEFDCLSELACLRDGILRRATYASRSANCTAARSGEVIR